MPRWTKRRKSRMNFTRAGLSSNRKRDEFHVDKPWERLPSIFPRPAKRGRNRCNHAERQCELASPATCLRRPRLVVLGSTIPPHAVAARAQKFLLELRRSRVRQISGLSVGASQPLPIVSTSRAQLFAQRLPSWCNCWHWLLTRHRNKERVGGQAWP